jgi:cephalosporin-C deacetylase
MNYNKHPFITLFLFFFPCFSYSQVKITMDNVKATYAAGQKAVFRISSNVAGSGTYSIFYDPRDPSSVIKTGNFTIRQGQSDTVVVFGLPHPGVVFFKVEQNFQTVTVNAVFDPHNIQPIEAEPADFDDFWRKERSKLRNVGLNLQLSLRSVLPNGSKLYMLRLDNVDNRTVNGYIAIPAGNGPFPAVVQMPPYGTVVSEPDAFIMTDFAEKCNSIIVMLTAHNTPPNQEDPNAYRPENLSDPLQYYNRWMILGGIRAIDYVTSRPDFNGSLGVNGNSQGGGLAISVAGLDDRVKAVLGMLPANAEQQGTRYRRASGFPRYNIGGGALGLDTNLVKTASKYHDAIYFLKRFKGAAMIITGYKDDVTPTATHFAAYNQLTESAAMLHMRDIGHNNPDEYWFGRYSFFQKHLTGFVNPFSFKKNYDIKAGPDQRDVFLDSVILRGLVFKDGLEDNKLPVLWEKVSGPGTITFENTQLRTTKARFSQAGTYVLRFYAEDEYLLNDPTQAKFYSMRDLVTITVKSRNTGNSTTDPEQEGLVVSPNPSAGVFKVRWDTSYNYQKVSVMGTDGRSFFEQMLNPSVKDVSLDLDSLPDGTYTLVFVNIFGRRVSKKIVKIK